MKIKLTQQQKIELLKAVKTGYLDTAIIPELHLREPARLLTKAEAKELMNDLETGKFEDSDNGKYNFPR